MYILKIKLKDTKFYGLFACQILRCICKLMSYKINKKVIVQSQLSIQYQAFNKQIRLDIYHEIPKSALTSILILKTIMTQVSFLLILIHYLPIC